MSNNRRDEIQAGTVHHHRRRRTVRPSRRWRGLRPLLTALAALLVAGASTWASTAGAQSGTAGFPHMEIQSLDGSGNNKAHPDWGKAGTTYSRVAAARYADGRSKMVGGPNTRFVSNRVINDINQNIFSERRVSQWGFTWGQFLDHTFGLRAGGATGDPQGETADIPFNAKDPMEDFVNDLGVIGFTRSAPAPGTGVNNPRQQVNNVSSYIDAWPVYGGTQERLEFLRSGPVDSNIRNNAATLFMPDRYLPRVDSRGNAQAAPAMEVDGRLRGQPTHAVVAGDKRANENIALTATHTLFAREHNRIVSLLPKSLSEEQKFQIARRVVMAEEQFITYNEFLPTMGVRLAPYRGYDPNVNANLGNEFATVGYRAHSQIHGEVEVDTQASRYSAAQVKAFENQGIEVTKDGADVNLVIPLNVAFFNPDLVKQIQLGPLLQGIGSESEYKNDAMIDNQLRSVLFQVPVSGNPGCLDGPELPKCFRGVVDLGAIDIERGRDHGMPSYNDLRRAYGLPPKTSFRDIVGVSTEEFPRDAKLTRGNEINDRDSLEFVKLFDINGKEIRKDSPEAETSAVASIRRTTTAARLKAVYKTVDKLDAFMGMIAERHLPGTEFGELQLAIWKKQFEALRDGDRFFFGNDPGLSAIKRTFGIDFHKTLGDVIALNTDIRRGDLAKNVFLVQEAADGAAAAVDALPARRDGGGVPLLAAAATVPTRTVAARRRGNGRRRAGTPQR